MNIQTLEVNHPIDIDLSETFALIVKGGLPCTDYQWILNLREACIQNHVVFVFESTGPVLVKDHIRYTLDPKTAINQARKADIDVFYHAELFERLSKSTFRSRFQLTEKEIEYIEQKGWNTIYRHADEMIRSRLAPENISNDGRQTPMKGHPVFLAQHATATCCRGCLYKWHHIPQNKALNDWEINYVVSVIMECILKQYILKKNRLLVK